MTQTPTDIHGNPMLSRSQVTAILGVSRKALRYYGETGICKPAYIDEESRYWYYTQDQLASLMLITLAKDMGISIATINETMHRDDDNGIQYDSMFREAWHSGLSSMRHVRRTLKDAVRCRQAVADMNAVGQRDGWYLRYIPQRWCAIMAIGDDAPHALSRADAARRYEQLRASARAYGWSSSFLWGSVLSTNLNKSARSEGRTQAGYLYIELTSPPMPEPVGAMIIDSGCYKPAGFTSKSCATCTPADCAICGRMGSFELPEDLSPSELARPYLLTLDDMEQPYISGTWAAFTREKLAERGASIPTVEEQAELERADIRAMFPHATSDKQPGTGPFRQYAHKAPPHGLFPTPSRRPQLMPLMHLLPGGVSAAVLPPGVYLCKQHSVHDNGNEKAFADMMKLARTLPRHALTPDEEYRLHLADTQKEFHVATSTSGPVPMPFGEARVVAEPEKRGWFSPFRPIKNKDAVSLVTQTGLLPGTDCCVIDALVIIDGQKDASLHETQMLVYTPLLPET